MSDDETAPKASQRDVLADAADAARDESGAALGGRVGAPGDARTDPFALTAAWMAEAAATEPNDPDAMTLATAGPDGPPNARIVLLKSIEPMGSRPCGRGAFVWYTNYESAKGAELAADARAAIVLHWKTLRRQVRARGRVERVEPEVSDAYYASRAYPSRIGAWASAQSRPLENRAALAARVLSFGAKYLTSPPRPPHWGGFRLVPDEIEFWSDGAYRLHDRWRRRWTGAEWRVERLNP